ncbi:hypothetical protein BJX64DRAFT_18170 [Aspergillus heterothallicus]
MLHSVLGSQLFSLPATVGRSVHSHMFVLCCLIQEHPEAVIISGATFLLFFLILEFESTATGPFHHTQPLCRPHSSLGRTRVSLPPQLHHPSVNAALPPLSLQSQQGDKSLMTGLREESASQRMIDIVNVEPAHFPRAHPPVRGANNLHIIPVVRQHQLANMSFPRPSPRFAVSLDFLLCPAT